MIDRQQFRRGFDALQVQLARRGADLIAPDSPWGTARALDARQRELKTELETLQAEYDAVLIGTGLHLGRSTRIPGADHPDVMRAVEVLRRIWAGEPFEVPRSMVVIGGGNVAMDVARSVARLQRQRHGEVKVTVTALEALEQMLADPEEIEEAREEGVVIRPSRGPKYCVIENDHLTGLRSVRCLSVLDGEGRFHPHYDEEDVEFHAADLVVEAVGQSADLGFLGGELTERLEWQRGRMQVDGEGRTGVPWLWAAGDVVEGPDIVHAVAAGHRVAASIHAYLSETLEVMV